MISATRRKHRDILFCKFLQNSGEFIQQNIQYDDIFGDTVSKQTKVMRIMFIKIQRRKKNNQ